MVPETAMEKEWMNEQAEDQASRDVEGGSGLETKRRRQFIVNMINREMVLENAGDELRFNGEEGRNVYFDEEGRNEQAEDQASRDVEGGSGLETKRRRPFIVNMINREMVLEDAGHELRFNGEEGRSAYLDEDEADPSTTEGDGTKDSSSDSSASRSTEVEFSAADINLENGISAYTEILNNLPNDPKAESKQNLNYIKVGNGSDSYITSVDNDEDEIVEATEPKTQKHAHNEIAKVVKLDISELDFEKVLEEQETHDLFCPNCNSCITKRVILRKRKRRVSGFQHEERPGKLHVKPNIIATSVDIVETSHDNEPDVFRCLSCFSYFTQTEHGFNIFRIFRKREENVKMQVPNIQFSGQTSSRDGNWLSSIFKPESSKKKGNEAARVPPQLVVSSSSDLNLEENQNITDLPLSVSIETEGSYKSDEKINSATQFPVMISSGGDYLPNEDKNTVTPPVSEADSAGGSYATNLTINSGVIKPLIINKPVISGGLDLKNLDVFGIIPPATILLPHDDDMIKPISIVEPSSQGTSQKDLNISISGPPSTLLLPLGDVQINVGNEILGETRRENEWDVLKSIVYGGLIESVTSLGVVSSAAGAEASTLNIVAIGLANLIGGLFVILHDLSELKSSAATNQEDEPAGRYWKLLGRKSNFGLHATIAMISYILFGLLPPVIYGFSFRKSDEKEYKLMVVAASSLLCISLLAIGKAHVSVPRSYIKTFIYYLGLGFTASGLSYVAGVMINRFLDQLGLFEHNAPLPSPPSINLFGLGSGIGSWAAE